MLQTINTSRNAKTGDVAQTYRSGAGTLFATCPASCALNPNPEESTARIDHAYLSALLAAVPRDGAAFGYTHFPPAKWAHLARKRRDSGHPTTCLNYSADTREQARHAVNNGIPCVIALPESDARKHETVDGVRYVQCPATYLDSVTCESCGGGRPLCARAERRYVIVFPAHGAGKRAVGTDTRGGCYAAGGNVGFHWRKLAKRVQPESDGAKLRAWVRTLPRGKVLRHHVAGDIGRAI